MQYYVPLISAVTMAQLQGGDAAEAHDPCMEPAHRANVFKLFQYTASVSSSIWLFVEDSSMIESR